MKAETKRKGTKFVGGRRFDIEDTSRKEDKRTNEKLYRSLEQKIRDLGTQFSHALGLPGAG